MRETNGSFDSCVSHITSVSCLTFAVNRLRKLPSRVPAIYIPWVTRHEPKLPFVSLIRSFSFKTYVLVCSCNRVDRSLVPPPPTRSADCASGPSHRQRKWGGAEGTRGRRLVPLVLMVTRPFDRGVTQYPLTAETAPCGDRFALRTRAVKPTPSTEESSRCFSVDSDSDSFDQWGKYLNASGITGTDRRCTWYGECYCSKSFVVIKRDCKKTNCYISDIGTGLGLGPELKSIVISSMQNSAGLGSVLIIQSQKYAHKMC